MLRAPTAQNQSYKPSYDELQPRNGETVSQPTMESKPIPEYKNQAQASTTEKNILGQRPQRFWAWILLLISAICIAVGVGVGVGLTRNSVSAEKKSLETLEKYRGENNFPALAVGKSILDRPFKSQVTGVRKQGDPTPVLITDQFHLGSNTKAMTATLLALMIQEAVGNLTWQTTLAEALPSFSNMSEGHRSTTLEMLTSQHSGIYDELFGNDQDYFNSLYMLSATEGRRSITHRVLSEPPAQVKGKFKYANANYMIAGYIIDTVANTTFEEVASVRLFEPLGMSSAGFGPVPESSNTSIDNPWPHTMELPSPIPHSVALIYRDNPPAYGPAGGAYCSLSDYAKFLRLQLDGAHGRINATSPFNLNTAGFQHLHTAYPDNDNETSYTYGGWGRLNFSALPDDYLLSHDGSNTWYFAGAEIHMSLDSAYMAMTNVANGTPELFSPAIHSIIRGATNGSILHY